jgi:hypothetical protein
MYYPGCVWKPRVVLQLADTQDLDVRDGAQMVERFTECDVVGPPGNEGEGFERAGQELARGVRADDRKPGEGGWKT